MSRTNGNKKDIYKDTYIEKYGPTVNFITNILPVRNENIITQIASENMDQYRTMNNNTVLSNKIPHKNISSRNTPGNDISHMCNTTADGDTSGS